MSMTATDLIIMIATLIYENDDNDDFNPDNYETWFTSLLEVHGPEAQPGIDTLRASLKECPMVIARPTI